MSESESRPDDPGDVVIGPEDWESPENTMRERRSENPLQVRFLVESNRFLVAGAFMLATFLLVLLLGRLGPGSSSRLVTTTVVASVFGSIIIVIVTGVTLVLTVAQIVLSQEIDPLGDKREELEEEISFRGAVADHAGVPVSPVEPSRFLYLLVLVVQQRAQAVRDCLGGGSAPETEIGEFADDVIDHSDQVLDDLHRTEFGNFRTMRAVLDYNYSWKLYAARFLRARHGDDLAEPCDALDDLVETLELFGPAREYLKIQYFQWEIINLARVTLYSSVPAMAITAYMMLLFDPQTTPGNTLALDNAFIVASAAFAATLAPFALLLSYILRIVTVTKRTLAIGPFVLRATRIGRGD